MNVTNSPNPAIAPHTIMVIPGPAKSRSGAIIAEPRTAPNLPDAADNPWALPRTPAG